MKDKYYCHGCGFELQTTKEEELGYIKGIKEEKDEHYCKRCYDMIFHNKTPNTFLKDEDYWNLFEEIVGEDKLYVLVLDLFNLEGSIIDQMIDKLENKKIILVLNKKDLLPKLVKDSKIYSYIKKHPRLKKLNIIDYVIISTFKKYNIDILLEKINLNREDDVFLIGAANVGKSSLLNAIINSVVGENREYVSTSYYAGTTLGIINVPFDEKSNLIDTPGIIKNSNLLTELNKKSLEKLIPKKEVRARTFQLEQEQTLFISSLLQFDYVKGPKRGFTLYFSNYIDVHRSKFSNSKEFRDKNLGKNIILNPSYDELENIEFKTESIQIEGNNVDLVIDGLGWINFKNIDEKIYCNITIPKKTSYYIRKGLI